MNRHIACYCVGCSNGKACLVLPEPDAKPKSDRTKAFLASWSRATFGLGLVMAAQVAKAETLAEAHRMAAECIAWIRESDPQMADRIRREAFRR
jgi:hypothetical protein